MTHIQRIKHHIIILILNLVITPVWSQQVTTGGRHSLVICHDSTVQAWGYNGYGQLGDNTTDPRFSGVKVGKVTGASFIAAGLFHSIIITSDGKAWTCGRNTVGQLGDGSNTDQWEPVRINSLHNVISASGGGEHSLFLMNDGTVYACGLNTSGQLGTDSRTNVNIPAQLKDVSDIVQVAAGAEFSLFLKRDGSVWACGHNGFGQYGNGTNVSSNKPILIPGLHNITYISTGEWHSLFVKSDGTVWSCGRNQFGQLGLGHNSNINIVTQLPLLTDIKRAEAGGIHSVFVKNDGTAWACGLNSGGNNDGQLGDGTALDRWSPVQVLPAWGNQAIIHAEAAREHSLFQLQSGEVWGAGRNNYGQLGYGISTTSNSNTAVLSSKICDLTTNLNHYNNISRDEILIYPNPAIDHLNFKCAADIKIFNMKISSILGIEINLQNKSLDNSYVDISNMVEGIYLLSFDTNKGLFNIKLNVIAPK